MPKRRATTTLAIEILEGLGCVADVVERRVGHRLTRDFLGFGDVIAVPPQGTGVLVLQVTSPSNISARLKKVLSLHRNVLPVIEAQNWVEIWGVTQEGGISARSIYIGDDGKLQYKHRSEFVLFLAGESHEDPDAIC
jgi:hypothetical protein